VWLLLRLKDVILTCAILALLKAQPEPVEVKVTARATSPDTVSVTVRGPGGRRLSGARVAAVPSLPEHWRSPACVCATGTDGTITFSGLPAASGVETVVSMSEPYFGGYYVMYRPQSERSAAPVYPSQLRVFRSHCTVGEPLGLRDEPRTSIPVGACTCSFLSQVGVPPPSSTKR